MIIPTYNAENYLTNAVDSIITQTFGFENIEVIIVDDNSSDRTQDVIRDLANTYKNIVPIFLKKNSGSPSRPRNVGIKKASADYIMFLDNDDFYYPNMCKKMYSTIVEMDGDVVICRYKKFINNKFKKITSFLDKYDDMIVVDSIYDFPELMTSDFPSMIWNKIFKKNTLLDNNIFFPEKYLYEDVYFSIESFLSSKRIILLNKFFGYGWQVRKTISDNGSTSHTFLEKNLIKQFNGLIKIFSLLNEKNEFDSLKGEMLVGWTKLFLYTPLEKNCQLILLNKLKQFYKKYKITTRLYVVSLWMNILINIIIKIFSINVYFIIFSSKIIGNLYHILYLKR